MAVQLLSMKHTGPGEFAFRHDILLEDEGGAFEVQASGKTEQLVVHCEENLGKVVTTKQDMSIEDSPRGSDEATGYTYFEVDTVKATLPVGKHFKETYISGNGELAAICVRNIGETALNPELN